MSPRSNQKSSTWSAVNLKKTLDLDELLTWARDMVTWLSYSTVKSVNLRSNIISEKPLWHRKLTSINGELVYWRCVFQDFPKPNWRSRTFQAFPKFGELGRIFPCCSVSTRFYPVVDLLAWQRFVRLDAQVYKLGTDCGAEGGGSRCSLAVLEVVKFVEQSAHDSGNKTSKKTLYCCSRDFQKSP